MAIAGLKLITPTSVAGSGVSLSGAKVVFTAATSVSVNGVFDSTYDNYLFVMRVFSSVTGNDVYVRWRASGTDNSTGSSYVYQRIRVDGTTVDGSRTTSDKGGLTVIGDALVNGMHVYMYGPALAQPTAHRAVTVVSGSDGRFLDYAGTHNQSTSYDGFTLSLFSGNITGALTVYGLSQ